MHLRDDCSTDDWGFPAEDVARPNTRASRAACVTRMLLVNNLKTECHYS